MTEQPKRRLTGAQWAAYQAWVRGVEERSDKAIDESLVTWRHVGGDLGRSAWLVMLVHGGRLHILTLSSYGSVETVRARLVVEHDSTDPLGCDCDDCTEPERLEQSILLSIEEERSMHS